MNNNTTSLAGRAINQASSRDLPYPSHNSDMDENDDVVLMNDSLHVMNSTRQRRTNDNAGTIQSTNQRIVQESVGRRRQRELASNNVDDLFKCFICFGKIEDAVICPSCSKLSCKDCMRKWLIEQR